MTLPDLVAYCPDTGERYVPFVSNNPSAEAWICLGTGEIISQLRFEEIAALQGGKARKNDPFPPGAKTVAYCKKCEFKTSDRRKLLSHRKICGRQVYFKVGL